MDSFYKLSRDKQQSIVRLYEDMIEKKYDDFDRRMEEEEFEKYKEERKKTLLKYKKHIKDNIIIV